MGLIRAILFFVVNVVVIATPLALFEIWLERYKSGWGGEFYSPFWGYKIEFSFLSKIKLGFLLKILEKTYVTPYHLLMFGLVLPGIFTAEFLWLKHLAGGVSSWVLPVGFWGISIVPVIYFVALWIGVATLEDFLWSALNWHYENAMSRFFSGDLAWHAKWSELAPGIKVPSFYISSPIWIAFLLISQWIVVSFSSKQ